MCFTVKLGLVTCVCSLNKARGDFDMATEIEVLGKVDAALSELGDAASLRRVLKWVIDKYDFEDGATVAAQRTASAPTEKAKPSSSQHELQDREIPGVALISDSGEFLLTVRDPKAKTTNDAAVRLALVTILAYCQLSGEKSASSRKIVKPVLEHWRAYTGNTRNVLSQHRGVIRNGDALSLDHHAQLEAERYVDEILDDELKGSWTPSGKRSSKSSNGAKSTDTVEA